MSDILISLDNINYSAVNESSLLFRGESSEILKDISFNIIEGEVTGICGESGGGKTTLAKIIAGIFKPVSGKIRYNFSLRENGISKIQILFQNNSDLLNPYRKVKDVLSEALKLNDVKTEELNKKKDELLRTISLKNEIEERRGYELSGGERQRVALARLLAVNPKVLILDEPFSAQDINSQLNLLKLLNKINREFNITMICISHDLKILRRLADRIIVIENGRIVEQQDTNELFQNPQHSYTKFLLRAENYSLTGEEIHSFKS